MRPIDPLPAGSSDRHRRRAMFDRAGLILLLACIIAGMIYSAILPAVARFSDETDYLQLSSNLLHGPGFSLDGTHLTALRPPGYAFFLAAIRAVGGGFVVFRFVQILLLATTILLVCQMWSDQKPLAGLLIVTGLVICYPVLLYTSATLYPQTLSAVLFLFALSLIVAQPATIGRRLLAGFAFGALILVVPTFLFTLAVLIVAGKIFDIIPWRDGFLIGLASLLVVGTWTARNAIVFHRFEPIASNSGANLLMGNNALASPFEAAANAGMGTYYLEAEKLGLNEFDSDRLYRDAAVEWVAAHPARAFKLYLEKVLNFFNIMNVYVPGIRGEVSLWKQVTMAGSYLLLMGLLLWRLSECGRYPLLPREKMFLALYVATAFTAAIFFTRIRHRLPYDYLIIAIVALHLSRRLEVWSSGKGAMGRLASDECDRSAAPPR